MGHPLVLADDGADLGPIRPGDGVFWGQACAEPAPLVDRLLGGAAELAPLKAFVGLSFRDLADRFDGLDEVVSYGALGGVGQYPGLRTVPCHYSAIPRLLAERRLPGDVALVQVAPPDSEGNCSLGTGIDYVYDALQSARLVVAEVNEFCPRTRGPAVPWSRLDAVLHTARPLVEMPRTGVTDRMARIARNVAAVIEDGDTVQVGIGSLPEAIIDSLQAHTDLGLHTGMVSEGILDLIEAGVVNGRRKPVDCGLAVATMAVGGQRLFDAVAGREDIELRPVSRTHDAGELAAIGPLSAINTVVELDLSGQANGERIGERRVGAIGGQVDFLRAAARGGKPVIALPADRMVARLTGPVSTARSDVDWVVTEHGARSLRGLTEAKRREALLALAGAERAAALEDAEQDLAYGANDR